MFSGYYICEIMIVIACSLIQAGVTPSQMFNIGIGTQFSWGGHAGSFKLTELETVGSSPACDLALTQHYSSGRVAVSVEQLNCSVFWLSFLAGGGPSVRSSSDSHSLLLTLSVMSYSKYCSQLHCAVCMCSSTIYWYDYIIVLLGVPCPPGPPCSYAYVQWLLTARDRCCKMVWEAHAGKLPLQLSYAISKVYTT